MNKIPVGILGATGIVGQRFVQLLADHPWFEVSAVAASERSMGQRYADACRWLLSSPIPESVSDLIVDSLEPGLACRWYFPDHVRPDRDRESAPHDCRADRRGGDHPGWCPEPGPGIPLDRLERDIPAGWDDDDRLDFERHRLLSVDRGAERPLREREPVPHHGYPGARHGGHLCPAG